MTVFAGNRIFASDINTIINVTTAKPLVRLVQQTAQTLADNTDVAIQFAASSEVFDTNGWHDTVTNNTRVTPTVAGYYSLRGCVYFAARTDYANLAAGVRVNGSIVATTHRQGPNTTNSVRSVNVGPITVQLNGSTDYVELTGLQDNTTNVAGATFVGAPSASFFEVELIRLT